MNKFINKHIKKLMLLAWILSVGIVAVSASYIFSSNEVSYDNTASGMSSNNVQDAIDELYGVARLSERIDELEEKLNNYWKTVYPVGSIYISTNSTNPSSKFGGTWASYGSGKTIVGVDSSQTEFNSVEKTGGSKTNSYTPSGTNSGGAVGNHTLTTAQIPSHSHTIYGVNIGATKSGVRLVMQDDGNLVMYNSSNTAIWKSSTSSSTSKIYRSVYIGPDGTSSGTGGGGAHNHTFTQPTFKGNAANISTVQPYITVYMWKRTA